MSNYPTDLQHIAIYLRKSRADLEAEARGEGETLSKHRRALFEIAKKYRYSIDDVYEEIVSGERIVDRPEMQKLLHAVQEGKYQAVLCMDIDRLGRGNMVDQGLIQAAFKSSNTMIITPRKVYNLRDEMDEEWSEFEAFMARRELKIINRRLQRGRRMSAAEGKSISKKPPYGYLRDENLKLYPDPETAPVVRMIFEMAASGLGRVQISHKLYELGIPSPSGNPRWERTMISEILRNPVYLGHIVWGRVRYEKKLSGTGYIRRRTSQNEWVIKKNAHESLVDEETFEKAREMAQINMPKIPSNADLSNPLASLVYCSKCGRAMRRQKAYNRPHNSLICITTGCETRGARFELVEQRLIDTLREFLEEFKADHKMKRNKPKSRNSLIELGERKLKDLQHEIEELYKQQNNLHDLLERGVYSVDTFLERSRVINERIEQAKKDIEEVSGELERLAEEEKQQEKIVPMLIHVLNSYNKAETAKEKNDLLKEIVERVEFTREKEWKKIDQFEIEVYLRL